MAEKFIYSCRKCGEICVAEAHEEDGGTCEMGGAHDWQIITTYGTYSKSTCQYCLRTISTDRPYGGLSGPGDGICRANRQPDGSFGYHNWMLGDRESTMYYHNQWKREQEEASKSAREEADRARQEEAAREAEEAAREAEEAEREAEREQLRQQQAEIAAQIAAEEAKRQAQRTAERNNRERGNREDKKHNLKEGKESGVVIDGICYNADKDKVLYCEDKDISEARKSVFKKAVFKIKKIC